jgi:hypothetical protein
MLNKKNKQKGGLFMRGNMWKMLLVFSALLMFAFTGELAAQTVDLSPGTDIIYYERPCTLQIASSGGDIDTIDVSVTGDWTSNPTQVITDGSGDATIIPVVGTTDEDLTITVSLADSGASGVTDVSTIDADPAPDVLTLTEPSRAIVPGEDLLIEATLTNEDGDPVQDTVVVFAVTAGDGSMASGGPNVTDASGVAIDTLTAGGSAGPRTITVEAAWSDGTIDLSDQVVVDVIDAPNQLTINPVTASVDVIDDEQTLTVTVTDGGSPAEGLQVDFEVITPSGAKGSVSPESGVTDDDGKISTTYDAGTVAGVDTVQATWTDELTRASLTATAVITIGAGPITKIDLTPVTDEVL